MPFRCTHSIDYYLAIFVYVILVHTFSAISTVEDEASNTLLHHIVYGMELSLAVYFGIEFALRLWSVGADARYQHFYGNYMQVFVQLLTSVTPLITLFYPTYIHSGRLRYLSRPICLVDILILVVTVVVLIISRGHVLNASTLQNLRFLQILRLLHIDRQMTTWKLIRKMLQQSKFELMSAYYFAALMFLLLSVSVYTTEGMGEGADLDVKG